MTAVLRDRYGVRATGFEPLAGGLDSAARIYRIGPDLVLRVSRHPVSEATLRVPRALRDAGLTAVVAPRPTPDGELRVEAHELTWTVYPYVDGPNGYAHGMTSELWGELGSVLRTVHDADVPPEVRALLTRDSADVTAYDGLPARDAEVLAAGGVFAATWERHRADMFAMLDQLHRLSGPLRAEPRPQVLCHGDLHPGNVLVGADGLRLVDWDCVLLAPRERDFLFAPPGAFYSAYGIDEDALDWVALTYYRCERVLQDVLAFAAEAAADEPGAARWIDHVFAAEGEAADTVTAAARLPSELDVLTRR